LKLFNSAKDFFIKKKLIYIDSFYSLQKEFSDKFTEKIIAVDTEFTWRDTYFPRLNLIQVGTKNRIIIVDSQQIEDLSILKNILNSSEITKIFHSSRGDISVLFNCLNTKINNIFDTQLAYSFIHRDTRQISYKDLVSRYFYRNLSKSQTTSDWEKRPLSKEQLLYASEDVRYLGDIFKIQTKILRNYRLQDKFKQACEAEKVLAETNFSISRLKRLKKNKKISPLEEQIFLWREEKALELDIPPNNIFKEKNLKRLKNVITENKIKESLWIIKDENLRKQFLERFI